jgi:hypothetical protein
MKGATDLVAHEGEDPIYLLHRRGPSERHLGPFCWISGW